jgi:hypothetical protein
MTGWTLADLLRHLGEKGLHLHAGGTREGGPLVGNAFLTREERPWADLDGLHKDPARIGTWSGIVYCECAARAEAREDMLAWWGECGLRVGPFVFFGDPGMLAQIRGALPASP